MSPTGPADDRNTGASAIVWRRGRAAILDDALYQSSRALERTRNRRIASTYLLKNPRAPPLDYTPIPDGRNIRLLKLSRYNQRVICSFLTTPIDQAPSYEAISYVWGSADKTHSVLVEVEEPTRLCSVPITTTCHTVLAKLVPPSGNRHVWIDALCINQADEAEKCQQIPLMGDIYGDANRVVSYIGNGNEPACPLLEGFVRRLAEYSHGGSWSSMEEFPVPFEEEEDRWAEFVAAFHDTQYWERGWIVQEVARAKSIVLLYGDNCLQWSDLVLLQRAFSDENRPQGALYRDHDPSLDFIVALNEVARFNNVRRETLAGSRPPLWELVISWGDQTVTNARDIIYAFLGLSSDANDPLLQPQPGQSVEDVYTNFLEYSLSRQSTRLLDVGLSARSPELRLPSWVPNFDQYIYTDHCLAVLPTASTCLHFSVSHDRKLLDIRGSVVDEVAHVLQPLSSSSFEDTLEILGEPTGFVTNSKEMKMVYDHMWKFINDLRIPGEYPSGCSLEVAFWRLCCLDLAMPREGERVLVVEEQAIEALANVSVEKSLSLLHTIDKDTVVRTLVDEAIRQPPFTQYADPLLKDIFWSLTQHARYGYRSLVYQKFVVTRDGYIGWAPLSIAEGDVVCAFDGSTCLYALRPNEDGTYQFVGPMYVQGLMRGETYKLPRRIFTLK